jgi:predicted Zn-dependent protease
MTRRLTAALILALALPLLRPVALDGAAFPRPGAVKVEAPGARISWIPVDGAQLYRVAVFDAPDAEGKRLLLAAVWVAGDHWSYGSGPVVARAAKLNSTKALPLPAGHRLRVMVAAAGADGADKSEWTGADFEAAVAPEAQPQLEAVTATASPSPTASPTPAGQPEAASGTADATLDIEGGDEFKTSPEPAVIDLQDQTRTAAVGATATATDAAPAPAGTLASAQALLNARKDDDAEAAFKALLTQDPRNAAAWEGLGDSYADRSMKVEAADAYGKALAINADNKRLKAWMESNVRE